MSLTKTKRGRGTPVSEDVATFWNIVKVGLVTAGAIGAISHPAIGVLSLGGEAINQVQGFIAGRRSEEFVQDVADDLYEAHQAHKLTVEQIQQVISSEEFTSALLQSRVIAMRTHQEEKLDALRNAVLNVAIGTAPEDHFQAFYLSLIDTLTPTHLRMLRQFKLQQSVKIVESPEWLKSNVAAQIAKDLLDRGLLGTGPGHALVPNRDQLIIGRDGVYTFDAVPSFLGNEFLSFITDPVKHD